MESLSGAIIAGGRSLRMGVDKATIVLNQNTFLEKSIALLSPFSKHLFLSSNTNYGNIDIPIIKDIYENIGPISGLYSILKEISTDKVFVIPVDTPLLTKDVIQYVLNKQDKTKQISVCETDDGVQMLIGIYDKSILPIIENQIKENDYKLTKLLKKANIQLINVEKFSNQLANINTQIDLANLKDKNTL